MKKNLKPLRLATETLRSFDLLPAGGGGGPIPLSTGQPSGCLTCRPPTLGCP
jgi:hypothetical protein